MNWVQSYSIKGELFGHDYRRQLPYHLKIINTLIFQVVLIYVFGVFVLAYADSDITNVNKNIQRQSKMRKLLNNIFFKFFDKILTQLSNSSSVSSYAVSISIHMKKEIFF
jgi:hypothetical protein